MEVVRTVAMFPMLILAFAATVALTARYLTTVTEVERDQLPPVLRRVVSPRRSSASDGAPLAERVAGFVGSFAVIAFLQWATLQLVVNPEAFDSFGVVGQVAAVVELLAAVAAFAGLLLLYRRLMER